MLQNIFNRVDLKTLQIIAGQSAKNSVIGLLWLVGPVIVLSGYEIEGILFVAIGIISWFFIFVFIPVFVLTFLQLRTNKIKRLTNFLQSNIGFYLTISSIVVFGVTYCFLDSTNDAYLFIFISLICLFSLSLNLRALNKSIHLSK
jgi:hypothetical protein